jgi:hypothetical protein
LGGLFNNQSFILGGTISYNIGNYTRELLFDYKETKLQNDYNLWQGMLGASISAAGCFPKKSSSLLSVSPKVVLRFQQRFGDKLSIYPLAIENHQFAVDIRIWKILLGSSFSNNTINYSSNYIGFKTTRIKFTCGFRFTNKEYRQSINSADNIIFSEMGISLSK